MSRYYRLDGHDVVPCEMLEWGLQMEERYGDRDPWRVARTDIKDAAFVSTVFLGLDHNYWCCGHVCTCPGGEHVPLVFETMVFGLPTEEEPQWRCSTWDQAVAQHAEVVAEYREEG